MGRFLCAAILLFSVYGNCQEISGDFAITASYESNGDDWYSIYYGNPFTISISKDGKFTMEGYEFLSDLSGYKAKTLNMKGYSTAELLYPKYLKTSNSNGKQFKYYSGRLDYKTRENIFGFQIEYCYLIQGSEVVGFRIHKAKSSREFLFYVKRAK